MSARDRLSEFAVSRPTPSHGGMSVIAAATGQVARVLAFVNIALEDFASARSSWRSLQDEFTERIRTAGDGVTHRMSDEENSIFERKQAAHAEVEFRIDAYYVFARILLDRIVVLIDLALTRTGTTIGASHSDLERLLARRCKELGIEFPEDLRSRIGDLSTQITEFRDHFVVHLQSPRASRGLGFDLHTPRVYASVGWMNPRDTDEFVQSADPHDLHETLLGYIESVVDFLETNSLAEE